jgi:hypothetical protein
MEDDHERRALPQHVDAETTDARHAPGAVEVAKLLDARTIALAAHELERDRLGLIGREPLLGERH